MANPIHLQINAMKQHFPAFRHKYNREGNLVFTGKLQPFETMPVYTISIEYREDSMPRVKVLAPTLVAEAPHVYPSGNLCLYKPDDFNWTATKPLSNYIIPWTSCWLFFYEVWKTTHEWHGPAATHNNTHKNE